MSDQYYLQRWLLLAAACFACCTFLSSQINAQTTWTTDGVPVCTSIGAQDAPRLISDGAGGVIVTWADRRGINYDIYGCIAR